MSAAILEVQPGTVTITRPAYLVAQFREATAATVRLHRQAREFSAADEQAYDAAERTASDARAALRAMVAAWGVEPDQLAEALS